MRLQSNKNSQQTNGKTELISQFPLFANLPVDEIQNLVETLQESHIQAGEVLFKEGTSSDQFFIILDGEVEIVKSLGTTDERVVATSKTGDMLGEMSMFTQSRAHSAAVRASTPLRLLMITFEQFDAILHRHPDLAYDMLRLYSRRLGESENLTILDLREKNRQLTQAYQDLQAAQAAMIEKEKLERELQIASEIQRGVLPKALPSLSGLDFGALMIPARQVGGDFYDFIRLDDHRIGVVVGDVCDKGMPAALFMALTYSSVRTEAFRQSNPGSTLQAINQHLMQINRSNMYVTLLYGILNYQTGEFSYARAGHPAPLVLDGSNQSVKIPFNWGQPIGLFERPAIDEQVILLPPGGVMLLYSDGLSETVEDIPDAPPLPQLCASLLNMHSLNAQALCEQLWRMAGGSAVKSLIKDDFTVVALRNLKSE